MANERYERQMIFPGLGKAGQAALGKASAVQAGCGALGSTLANCMVRAGIGKYTIIDKDVSEISNLPRQFLFDENDVKRKNKKALSAARKLRKANSEVEIKGIAKELNQDNVGKLLSGHDLVLDALDNMETRYLVNEWCVKNRVPWIYGGVGGACGMTMVILPGKGPCLKCLFPEPEPGIQAACTTELAGIINTAPALIASLQATEAVKLLTESPDLIMDLRMVDLWSGEFQRIGIARNPECPCCRDL